MNVSIKSILDHETDSKQMAFGNNIFFRRMTPTAPDNYFPLFFLPFLLFKARPLIASASVAYNDQRT